MLSYLIVSGVCPDESSMTGITSKGTTSPTRRSQSAEVSGLRRLAQTVDGMTRGGGAGTSSRRINNIATRMPMYTGACFMSASAHTIASLDRAGLHDVEVRMIQYPSGTWQPTHTHHRPSVTLVLSGTIEEVRNHTSQIAMPLSLIVKKAGVPHADRFGPNGATTLQISLPATFDLDECGVDTRQVVWHTDGGRPIDPILKLVKCLLQRPTMSVSDVTYSLYQALGALPSRDRIGSEPPMWLLNLKTFIDASDPTQPLPMNELHEHAAIHPVHITRQFSRHFGCTVRDYMQYRRIRAAVTMITESSASLTQIAYQCAFADQAHFCRAFRSIAGLTARDYRKLTKMIDELNVENVQVLPS
jgi:AraC family transcriptional regulator